LQEICFYFKSDKGVQVQLIYPATEAHITKYSKAECFFLLETAEDWQNTTSPYLKEKSFDLTVKFTTNKVSLRKEYKTFKHLSVGLQHSRAQKRDGKNYF